MKKRKLQLFGELAIGLSTSGRCRIKHALNLLLCRFKSVVYGHYEHRRTDRLNHCNPFEFITTSKPQ